MKIGRHENIDGGLVAHFANLQVSSRHGGRSWTASEMKLLSILAFSEGSYLIIGGQQHFHYMGFEPTASIRIASLDRPHQQQLLDGSLR